MAFAAGPKAEKAPEAWPIIVNEITSGEVFASPDDKTGNDEKKDAQLQQPE